MAKLAETGVRAACAAGAADAVPVRTATLRGVRRVIGDAERGRKGTRGRGLEGDGDCAACAHRQARSAHVVAWVKRAGLTPPRLTEVIASAALPVLLSVSVWLAEAVPATEVNASVAGVRVALATPDTVPVSATVCTAGEALSVTARVALELPTAVCVKPMVIVQDEFAARLAAQVCPTILKEPGFEPPSVTEPTVSERVAGVTEGDRLVCGCRVHDGRERERRRTERGHRRSAACTGEHDGEYVGRCVEIMNRVCRGERARGLRRKAEGDRTGATRRDEPAAIIGLRKICGVRQGAGT